VSTNPDLESDLCELVNMAHIAATLLEDSFGNKKAQEEITRLPNTYYLSDEDTAAMIFVSCEVYSRLRVLLNKYRDSSVLRRLNSDPRRSADCSNDEAAGETRRLFLLQTAYFAAGTFL
jgi:hypothetical protein